MVTNKVRQIIADEQSSDDIDVKKARNLIKDRVDTEVKKKNEQFKIDYAKKKELKLVTSLDKKYDQRLQKELKRLSKKPRKVITEELNEIAIRANEDRFIHDHHRALMYDRENSYRTGKVQVPIYENIEVRELGYLPTTIPGRVSLFDVNCEIRGDHLPPVDKRQIGHITYSRSKKAFFILTKSNKWARIDDKEAVLHYEEQQIDLMVPPPPPPPSTRSLPPL